MQADDLVTPAYLAGSAVAAVVGCILVIAGRRLLSYAIGAASIPAAIVAACVFWATLQFDIRDYPDAQLWSALVAAIGPYVAIAVVYYFIWSRRPNKSPETNALRRQ